MNTNRPTPFFALLLTLSCLLLLNACGYMQTRHIVKESARYYEGVSLQEHNSANNNTQALYRSGNTYYIALPQYHLRKKYPLIHDTVFRGDSEPSYKPLRGGQGRAYYRISAASATVLQQSGGYFSYEGLMEDIRAQYAAAGPAASPTHLPNAQRLPLRARIARSKGKGYYFPVSDTPVPPTPSILNHALSKACYVIDVPGTIIYNLCSPILSVVYFTSGMIRDERERRNPDSEYL